MARRHQQEEKSADPLEKYLALYNLINAQEHNQTQLDQADRRLQNEEKYHAGQQRLQKAALDERDENSLGNLATTAMNVGDINTAKQALAELTKRKGLQMPTQQSATTNPLDDKLRKVASATGARTATGANIVPPEVTATRSPINSSPGTLDNITPTSLTTRPPNPVMQALADQISGKTRHLGIGGEEVTPENPTGDPRNAFGAGGLLDNPTHAAAQNVQANEARMFPTGPVTPGARVTDRTAVPVTAPAITPTALVNPAPREERGPAPVDTFSRGVVPPTAGNEVLGPPTSNFNVNTGLTPEAKAFLSRYINLPKLPGHPTRRPRGFPNFVHPESPVRGPGRNLAVG